MSKANKCFFIILVGLFGLSLSGDVANTTKEPTKKLKNERIIDQDKFNSCMQTSQKEGKSLDDLKRECKDYAETITGKVEAAAKCIKWKKAEIGWTNKEIDLYCNKMWRGYR